MHYNHKMLIQKIKNFSFRYSIWKERNIVKNIVLELIFLFLLAAPSENLKIILKVFLFFFSNNFMRPKATCKGFFQITDQAPQFLREIWMDLASKAESAGNFKRRSSKI